MKLEAANVLAFEVGRAVLDAARPLDVEIEGVTIHVVPQREAPIAWPALPYGKPIPGLDEQRHGPWPSAVRLDCSWKGGHVTLVARWSTWRANPRYHGQLALEVATAPRNRQIVWSTVTQRILDVSPEGEDAMLEDAVIPVSLSLFDREKGDEKRAYLRYQIELARKLGLPFTGAATATLFRVPQGFSGALAPDAFARVVRAALVKLPFVTRGEDSDVEGEPYLDIRRALAPSKRPVPGRSEGVPEAAAGEPPPDLAGQDSALFDELGAFHFGPFEAFSWTDLGRINVIIGRNDTGKSTLLKLGYALARSVQDYTRRMEADRPSMGEVLAEKFMWTFQPASARLGDLVKKRSPGDAVVGATLCNAVYSAILSASDARSLRVDDDGGPQPNLRALFIPPKEILTSVDAITSLHEQDKRFGFDDTYYDLAVALRGEVIQEDLPDSLRRVLNSLRELFSGEIVRESGRFVFRRGDDQFWMSQVAEGIKKIGLFARLIQNGELRRNTVLFIDEPETNLHPAAARALVRMLHDVSLAGVQIFMATHSYFILKQLELVARQHKVDVRLCALTNREGHVSGSFHDLSEGMPPNEIVEEELSMGDEDVDLAMAG
ncbi:AAA family ATPase [Sorangium sp. So ce1151]|uniref:AAA family ATPase n=1 Tax=Sorangium sp. So ce1151 TaxID=3133332 RepID=UPI003F5EB5BB